MTDQRISVSWLRDNWRPLSALLLATLPLLRAVGLAKGLSDEAFQSLLEVTGLFLALYAGGRTLEKVQESRAQAQVDVAVANAAAQESATSVASAVAEVVGARIAAAMPQAAGA